MKLVLNFVKQNEVKERIALVRAIREIDNYEHKIKFYLNLLKNLERYGNYEIEIKEVCIKKYKPLFIRNGIEITSENESKMDSLIEELDAITLDCIELPKNITNDYRDKIFNDIKSLRMRLIYIKTGKLVDGHIPPYTECPYKNKCAIANSCYHLGEEHSVAFSCGFARTFEV